MSGEDEYRTLRAELAQVKERLRERIAEDAMTREREMRESQEGDQTFRNLLGGITILVEDHANNRQRRKEEQIAAKQGEQDMNIIQKIQKSWMNEGRIGMYYCLQVVNICISNFFCYIDWCQQQYIQVIEAYYELIL